MTQRIFDVENEKDMADLWDIVPENIVRIRKGYKSEEGYYFNFYDTKDTTGFYETVFLIIDWHDKKEITRPIQEAANKYGVCHESIRFAAHNGKASCGLHFALIKVGGK